jgi:1,4-alpha-glucan branching enzyme
MVRLELPMVNFPDFTLDHRPARPQLESARDLNGSAIREAFMAKQKFAKQKVIFSFLAPTAQSVQLAGDFTGWQQEPVALKKSKDGLWKTTVSLSAGRYEYRFLVDGQWCDDPACKIRQSNQMGGENCVRVV